MTIQVNLDPAMELQVSLEARSRGISMEEYVRETLIEKAQARLRVRIPERKMTTQEFLDAMAYHGPISEEMHTQEITRAFIYGDHP